MTTPSLEKFIETSAASRKAIARGFPSQTAPFLSTCPRIVFDGAEGELLTQVDIQAAGLFIGWEITCLGRFDRKKDEGESGIYQ